MRVRSGETPRSPVVKPVAEVPADGNQNDLGRELEPGEPCPRWLDRLNEISALHFYSLARQRPRHELCRD